MTNCFQLNKILLVLYSGLVLKTVKHVTMHYSARLHKFIQYGEGTRNFSCALLSSRGSL